MKKLRVYKVWSTNMKLYRIYQTVNHDYDTLDSAIVCAESKGEARMIHPRGDPRGERIADELVEGRSSWVKQHHVKVELIGRALKKMKGGTVVCASFNAG